MATFNAHQGRYQDDSGYMVLPSDVYRMKIKKADIQEDTFAEPRDDGSQPDQLVLCWEVSTASADQDESVVGLSVWQRMAPWYGVTKRGPSKFKVFIDSLVDQGILENLNLEEMDTTQLEGIEQRVTVEEYLKTMGQNKGQPGNKVVAIMPLIAKKATPKPTRPTSRNVPQPVEDESEIPF